MKRKIGRLSNIPNSLLRNNSDAAQQATSTARRKHRTVLEFRQPIISTLNKQHSLVSLAKVELLFGEHRGNVRTPSIARCKARGRLPIRHNGTFFRYLLRLRRYKRKSVEVVVFRRRWVGHFERKFQTEGVSPTKHCQCQKTTVIALSCGTKISVVYHLVLSQCTYVTSRQTDGQNYDSQGRASIAARAVK